MVKQQVVIVGDGDDVLQLLEKQKVRLLVRDVGSSISVDVFK